MQLVPGIPVGRVLNPCHPNRRGRGREGGRVSAVPLGPAAGLEFGIRTVDNRPATPCFAAHTRTRSPAHLAPRNFDVLDTKSFN